MKILVTGATGLVGAEVIREAIKDDEIKQITAIARRSLSIRHPKLTTILHEDFLNYNNLLPVIAAHDVCLWCLGISQTQVNKEQYHVITYDYAIAAANAIKKANPAMTFLFLSGEGADQTEKSRQIFARVKGKTEKALLQLGLSKLYIARPGGIRPINKNPNAPFLYKLLIPLFPLMEFLTPRKMINSVQVARALLNIVKTRPEKVIIENVELKELAK
jgi:uncharacterized protein YbjT (DUF2867 family)